MNKDWFEKALREGYPNEAKNFDTDAAWAALEARRRKKRRRPVVFWWMASAIGVLLLGAASLALWSSDKETSAPGIRQHEHAPTTFQTQQKPVAASGDTRGASEPGYPSGTSRPIVRQQEQSVPSTPVFPKTQTAEILLEASAAFALPPPVFATEQAPLSHSENDATCRSENISPDKLPALAFLERTIFPLEPALENHPEEPPFFTPGELKKRPNSKEPRWWIGASAHYGLSSVSRSGSADYLKKRDSEETSLDMFQAGFDLRRQINNRFFLQTGIYFTQWTDVREKVFKETFTVLDSNYLIARLIRADGTVEDIYGAAEIVHTRTVTEETYNRYSHLELPLLAGVSLPVGGHWRLDGALGPVVGLLAFRSGSISGDLNGTNLPLEDAPYRNGFTFSGMLRLEWMYATRDWAAGIGVMGRVALNDWAETNPLFSEKRHAIGAGLVIRKTLR